jgi:hypothetical protein
MPYRLAQVVDISDAGDTPVVLEAFAREPMGRVKTLL